MSGHGRTIAFYLVILVLLGINNLVIPAGVRVFGNLALALISGAYAFYVISGCRTLRREGVDMAKVEEATRNEIARLLARIRRRKGK